jgi:hypothetical protein
MYLTPDVALVDALVLSLVISAFESLLPNVKNSNMFFAPSAHMSAIW